MRKELIITVAGASERFSKSIGSPTLKCIYYEKEPSECLLKRLIETGPEYDRYVIVGGFKFEELEHFIEENLEKHKDRIALVENKYYREYGSGYSLFLGLLESFKQSPDEIVFAEGDLFLDRITLNKIYDSNKSVLTLNDDPITAKKAVALYLDREYKPHYLYDTNHEFLEIDEPFTAIYNSGQVWKFTRINELEKICEGLSVKEQQGTNLVIIQKYFDLLDGNEYESLRFNTWINCNTIHDYRLSKEA